MHTLSDLYDAYPRLTPVPSEVPKGVPKSDQREYLRLYAAYTDLRFEAAVIADLENAPEERNVDSRLNPEALAEKAADVLNQTTWNSYKAREANKLGGDLEAVIAAFVQWNSIQGAAFLAFLARRREADRE